MSKPDRLHVFDHIRHPKKRAFLMAFSQCGEQGKSARAVGIDRTTIWVWKQDDPAFVEAYAHAQEIAGDELEEIALERAKAGSDCLTIFLLKGMKPEKYGDAIRFRKPVEKLTDEELDAVIASGKDLASTDPGG